MGDFTVSVSHRQDSEIAGRVKPPANRLGSVKMANVSDIGHSYVTYRVLIIVLLENTENEMKLALISGPALSASSPRRPTCSH